MTTAGSFSQRRLLTSARSGGASLTSRPAHEWDRRRHRRDTTEGFRLKSAGVETGSGGPSTGRRDVVSAGCGVSTVGDDSNRKPNATRRTASPRSGGWWVRSDSEQRSEIRHVVSSRRRRTQASSRDERSKGWLVQRCMECVGVPLAQRRLETSSKYHGPSGDRFELPTGRSIRNWGCRLRLGLQRRSFRSWSLHLTFRKRSSGVPAAFSRLPTTRRSQAEGTPLELPVVRFSWPRARLEFASTSRRKRSPVSQT